MSHHLAIYWDFENVHASLFDLENGAGAYRKGRFAKQPDLVSVDALMGFILPRGRVAVNRAYANWTWLSALKSTMLQLDPAFDEESYGFGNFADFVAACQDLVSIVQGPHEKHLSLKAHRPASAPPLDNPGSPLEYYRRILRQQQINLIPGERFARLCQAVSATGADGLFCSWDDFNSRVKAHLATPPVLTLDEGDLTRLKQVLFKVKVFLLGDNSILLQPDFLLPDTLLTHVFRQIVSRLLRQPELRWDGRLVSQLLYGDEVHEDLVNKWFQEASEEQSDDVS